MDDAQGAWLLPNGVPFDRSIKIRTGQRLSLTWTSLIFQIIGSPLCIESPLKQSRTKRIPYQNQPEPLYTMITTHPIYTLQWNPSPTPNLNFRRSTSHPYFFRHPRLRVFPVFAPYWQQLLQIFSNFFYPQTPATDLEQDGAARLVSCDSIVDLNFANLLIGMVGPGFLTLGMPTWLILLICPFIKKRSSKG